MQLANNFETNVISVSGGKREAVVMVRVQSFLGVEIVIPRRLH